MEKHVLKISALSIDFLSSNQKAKARLTLGRNWRHRYFNVWLNDDQSEKGVCVQTNCHGEFTIKIGPEVEQFTVTVSPKDTCVAVTEEFSFYSMRDLVWRLLDGSSNNMNQPAWGSIGQPLLRIAPVDFSRLGNIVNPRRVSNAICAQTISQPNSMGLKTLVFGFGQFVDHEIDITHDNSGEPFNMTTSIDDPFELFPNRTIPFNRSAHTIDSDGIRQPANSISCFIDGTNVYGFTVERSHALRKLDGTGMLKTVDGPDGPLMPDNSIGLENANPTGLPLNKQFLAGDVRANENLLLLAFHTLFVREHNRLCTQIMTERPEWIGADELIYQKARCTVIGIMQNICFNEFLPALFGEKMPEYGGYDPTVNPNIATEFSTVGFRFGHSMVTSELDIVQANGSRSVVALRDGFFTPDYLRENGIDNILRGSIGQVMEEIDGKIVDDVRNFLFGPPTANMLLDLVSLNIQRGRDHGIAGYNAVRQAYGLTAKPDFASVSNDPIVVSRLADLYDSVDQIDAWIGALVEPHLEGAAISELTAAILKDQFERLRSGDRFWFEHDPAFTEADREVIRGTTLADVIVRNTGIEVTQVNGSLFGN